MQEIIHLFPLHLRDKLVESGIFTYPVEELRIRIGQPIVAWTSHGESKVKGLQKYKITKEDMRQMVSFISKCSLYAFEEEIKKGYLTLEGGHRVGLAGQVILDGKQVHTIRPITFLNIRIAHQVIGCGDTLAQALFVKQKPGNVLILSAPGAGKTTILRDMIRIMSDSFHYKMGIIDERSEIAGCHNGIPQNQIGVRSDVLDGCPKALGMMMMVRSMSPDYLGVDEIGSKEDMDALFYATNCGCGIIATMHCSNMEEFVNKPFWSQSELPQIFDYYVVLEKHNDQRVWTVYDRKLTILER